MTDYATWVGVILGVFGFFVMRELNRQDALGKERLDAALKQIDRMDVIVAELKAELRDLRSKLYNSTTH